MEKFTYYSDEFKKSVVPEVLAGQVCKDEARRRYGIQGKSAVLNWIRKFVTSAGIAFRSNWDRNPAKYIIVIDEGGRWHSKFYRNNFIVAGIKKNILNGINNLFENIMSKPLHVP